MLDALTLDQMRVLIAVSEAGSFSGGAERLGRAQSAVSYAIGNLEAQLGVTLFDRSGYRPVLTPEGRMLLADARAILLKVDTLRARARGFGEGVELGLDIALDPQFPLTVASRALKELQDAYPLVSVRVLSAPWVRPFSYFSNIAVPLPSAELTYPILGSSEKLLCLSHVLLWYPQAIR